MGVAGDARETLHVEDLLHGNAATAVTNHIVTTAGAASWGGGQRVEITLLRKKKR